jgi:hypothetical protein
MRRDGTDSKDRYTTHTIEYTTKKFIDDNKDIFDELSKK